MPRMSDPSTIRAILETDRPWAVYALGDLVPGRFAQGDWFTAPEGPPALALLYREFATPLLFTLGEPEDVRPLLDEIGSHPAMLLHVRPEILPLIRARYRVRHEQAMWRMTLDPARFRPAAEAGIARLGPAHVPAIRRLFAAGEATGEVPDFFFESMLPEGVFYGAWEGDGLVAVAGTHLVAPSEGVGAIGNVYTRRDRRGRGLATRLTGAVGSELLRLGLREVALNVNQGNAAALRVYERLGFAPHCAFVEGLALDG